MEFKHEILTGKVKRTGKNHERLEYRIIFISKTEHTALEWLCILYPDKVINMNMSFHSDKDLSRLRLYKHLGHCNTLNIKGCYFRRYLLKDSKRFVEMFMFGSDVVFGALDALHELELIEAGVINANE